MAALGFLQDIFEVYHVLRHIPLRSRYRYGTGLYRVDVVGADRFRRDGEVVPCADRNLPEIGQCAIEMHLLVDRLAATHGGQAEKLMILSLKLGDEAFVHLGRDADRGLCQREAPHILQSNVVGVEPFSRQFIGIALATVIQVPKRVVERESALLLQILRPVNIRLGEPTHNLLKPFGSFKHVHEHVVHTANLTEVVEWAT